MIHLTSHDSPIDADINSIKKKMNLICFGCPGLQLTDVELDVRITALEEN